MWDDLLKTLAGTTPPAPTPVKPPVVAQPSASAQASAPGNESPVLDVNSVIPSLRTDVGTMQEKAKAADSLLGQFSTLQQVVQAGNEKALGEAAKAKEAVNTVIQQQTADFSKTVQPVFQQRNEIAARKVALTQMNPFVVAIKGIFDPNYDADHLNEVDDALKGQLSAQGMSYQHLMGLNDTVLKTIDQHYEDQTNPANMALADKQADVTTAMQSVGSIQQIVGSELQGIQANSEALKAQAMARQDVLGRMTLDDANRYGAQAQKTGFATVNGVPISAAEIKDVQMHWQEQNLNLESRQLAITAQRQDLAETYERRAIAHMSAPALEAAIQNGGKLPNGQQLNQNYLTAAYASQVQRNDLVASQASQASGQTVYGAMLQGLHGVINQGTSRAASLFGQVPPAIQQMTNSQAIQLGQIAEGQKRANAAGAGDAYAAQMAPEIQKMQMQVVKNLDDLAARWGNGDKNLTAVAHSWLTGDPMNPGTAAAGMITMARKGIPPGMAMSGDSASTFKQVQDVVRKFDQSQNNPTAMAGRASIPKGEIDPNLLEKVQGLIQNAHVGKSMDTVSALLPQAAQKQGLNFGKMDPHDVGVAIAAGDSTAFTAMKAKLGLSEADTKLLFDNGDTNGPSGSAFTAYKKNHPKADYGQMALQYQQAQMTGALDALDHLGGQKGLPFKASQAYVEALNHPEIVRMMTGLTQNKANQSPGDFMIDNVAGTQFSSSLLDYGRLAQQTYSTAYAQKVNQALDTAGKLRSTSPIDSAKLALYTNPNLTVQDVNKLMAGVTDAIQKNGKPYDALQAVAGSTNQYSDMIDETITSSKFADPALERIRRIAAQDWATRHSKLKEGLLDLISSAAAPGQKRSASEADMQAARSINH